MLSYDQFSEYGELAENLGWTMQKTKGLLTLSGFHSFRKSWDKKGELLLTLRLCCYVDSRHMSEIWRLFSFTLENLITETYKDNNKYSNLDQVLICNIHCEPS